MTAALELPAFTGGLLRATNYMNEFGDGVYGDGGQKVFFEIHTNGRYFVDILQYSHYQSEGEYRCVRGTVLRVDSIKNRGGFIHIICLEV